MLQPNDFENLAVLARTLNAFERYYDEVATPVGWNFSRSDLDELLARLSAREPELRLAA